jgi:hypothetical protein
MSSALLLTLKINEFIFVSVSYLLLSDNNFYTRYLISLSIRSCLFQSNFFLTTHVPVVLLRATFPTSSTSPVNCFSDKPHSLSFAPFCSGFRPSLVNCVSDIVTRGFLSICPLFHIRAFGLVAYVRAFHKLILFNTLSMCSIYFFFDEVYSESICWRVYLLFRFIFLLHKNIQLPERHRCREDVENVLGC